MKRLLKTVTSLLLLFNGAGAIYGGWQLMRYPDGSGLSLPLGYIGNSPFHDYMVPGILLFVMNGLFSIFTLFSVFLQLKNYAIFIITQGMILTMWIVIQVFMVDGVSILHPVLGLTGVLLMSCGWAMVKLKIGVTNRLYDHLRFR